MVREWKAICKDCGAEFGYSDASYQDGRMRGLSRPERCAKCRQQHSREIQTLGLSHYELRPVQSNKSRFTPQPGFLGGLSHPTRIHDLDEINQRFDLSNFGITDGDVRHLFSLLRRHQVAVVVGPTGSGKSTFMPYRLMVPPEGESPETFTRYGQIIVTQPRIAATKGIPEFVAKDLHGSSLGAGYDVGFRYSGEKATDWRNKLVYVTDGTLINWIVMDQIGQFSVIMIDEAHERSLNIDLILGLLKAQLHRHPHLKLIVASATIDAEKFVAYYGNVPLQNVQDQIATGRSLEEVADRHGVGYLEFQRKEPRWLEEADQKPAFDKFGGPYYETRFREDKPVPPHLWPAQMSSQVASKVVALLQAMATGEEVEGDILAFLHGKGPIEDACRRIKEQIEEDDRLLSKIDVLPLFTELPQAEQKAAYGNKKDASRRRVVISTNVAETSLTVDGIVHVVDSGLIKESSWDSTTQTKILLSKVHSRAGCKQRWGRSGRVRHGIVHCLYTEAQFNDPSVFPPYTLPEIRRAPLEQIVLTAKAAGVDNVLDFDWIEHPHVKELGRSTRILTQRRALDEEGDLTEHGLELRGFMDEPSIANLMVLADRFACTIEMATLLAMMKVGGRRSLLRWNRDWDATTKQSVHRIHQGLIGPCQDDLEFYLKLYEAWAGSPTDEKHDPSTWARSYYVNHSVLKNKVKQERDKLLQPLTGHKKYDERRRLNFDLLTRLRMVLVYGLPDRVYLLSDQGDSPSTLTSSPIYRPYLTYADEEDLDLVTSDIGVEIHPESVCSGRLPTAFACLLRQSMRRRLSPRAEAETIIQASVLTLIKRDWLRSVGHSVFTLARLIAQETRDDLGELRRTADRPRLFLDQAYPIGGRCLCEILEGADQGRPRVLLKQMVTAPPTIIEVTRDTEVEAAPDVDLNEDEADPKLIRVLEGEEDSLSLSPEEDPIDDSPWLALVTEPSAEDPGTEERNQSLPLTDDRDEAVQVVGQLRMRHQQVEPTGVFTGEIEGFDFADLEHPTAVIRLPLAHDPYHLFIEKFEEGAEVDVVIRGIERYPNDYLTYLRVEHIETGLELMMEPEDISLTGRSFAVEVLRPGDVFRTTVEQIDKNRKRIHLSRLKEAEAVLLRFMGETRERFIDGRISEIQFDGVYILLNPEEARQTVPLGAFAGIQYLPARPEASMLGQPCRAKVRFNDRANWRRQLPLVPDSLSKLIEQRYWGDHITLTAEGSVLQLGGRMGYFQRLTLLGQSPDVGYRRAINWLYRRSNGLIANVIDIETIDLLVSAQQCSTRQAGTIVDIVPYGVFIELDSGFRGLVHNSEMYASAQNTLQRGQKIEVLVKDVDRDRGQAKFSMKLPENDPWSVYTEGKVVMAKITGLQNYGAFAELEPGVSGLIRRDELSWTRINQVEDIVSIGDQIMAQIIRIDRIKRELSLSLRLESNKPQVRFPAGTWHDGTVVGLQPYGCFVRLAPDVSGLVQNRDICYDHITDAGQVVSLGQSVRVQVKEIKIRDNVYEISLRLKNLDENPYRLYQRGSQLQGTVYEIQDFGVFVQFDSGGTGLIPTRELSWSYLKHPSEAVSIGTRIRGQVLSVNADKEELTLSKKELEEHPVSRYRRGMRLQGVVSSIQQYGAFVEIDSGGSGLIPLQELSWDFVKDPTSVISVGERLTVEVLTIDVATKKLTLTRKLPENDWLNAYVQGETLYCAVESIKSFGVIVRLPRGGTGLIHISELSWRRIEDPAQVVAANQYVQARIKAIDRAKRQVSLSVKALQPKPVLAVGQLVSGRVTKVEKFGAFVDLGEYGSGLIHISELSYNFVKNPYDIVNVGYQVVVKVLQLHPKISLSLKQAQ